MSPGDRRGAWLSLLAAVLLAAVAGWALLGALPAARAEQRAFAAAPRCPAADGAACVLEVPLTVVGKEHRGGKREAWWLRLAGADGTAFRPELPDGDSLFGAADGARVTAEFWRGGLVALRLDGARQETTATPNTGHHLPLALGLAALPLAAGALWQALWLGLRSWRNPLARPWQLRWAREAALASAAVGVLAGAVDEPDVPYAQVLAFLGVPVLAAAAGRALLLRRRDRTPLVDVPAVAAPDRVCVPGAVAGPGAPPRTTGHGCLVVVDGRLSTALDEGLSVRPYPARLVVERVRRPFRDDPLVGTGKRPLAVECREAGSGAPVLLTLDASDAPPLLAALRAGDGGAG
ncbi:hypothetical protein Kpho02_35690 [Kitasatospora phosalacinea]|uniref:Uncharacterized protein n=1 Tax=Kitasatospora phosalacinea TaxID=2065 RepID=A0A9W6V3N2_9ACTN|nr:hypothetical protein Kpho02_35690 [Kitasatospora phosalacinea]